MQTLTSMPESFAAGTTLKYERTLSDYPASDGWSLKLHLAGKSELTLEASVDGDRFVFLAAVGQTENLPHGVYTWVELASKDGETFKVDEGTVTVEPNLALASAGSLQMAVEKELDLIEARIQARLAAGADHESRSADNFSVELVSLNDLFARRNTLAEQLRSVASGGQFSRQVLVQFSGVGLER